MNLLYLNYILYLATRGNDIDSIDAQSYRGTYKRARSISTLSV